MMRLIEIAIRFFKGDDYRPDPRIPKAAIFSLAFRRLIWAVRGILMGLSSPFHPRDFVFVGPAVEIRNSSLVRIGGGSTLARGVLIDGLSEGGVNIGRNVSIGPYSQIEATGIITCLGKGFTIGDNSGMGAFSFVGAAGGVRIGNDVIMGQRVSFHSEDHRFEEINIPIHMQGVTRKGIEIGDDCWIGAGVTFLDGTHVESGCVIGAGAVVKGFIPQDSVAVGVPVRVIRKRCNDHLPPCKLRP